MRQFSLQVLATHWKDWKLRTSYDVMSSRRERVWASYWKQDRKIILHYHNFLPVLLAQTQ